MKIVLSLSQSQLKNAALAQAGIRGQDFGHRKARQVHKNKRAAHLRGQVKHRARAFD
jgi:hypothetical protein